MFNIDGGGAEVDEGEHRGKSGCNVLSEHRPRVAIPDSHTAGHLVCHWVCEQVSGRSPRGSLGCDEALAVLHQEDD